MSVQANQIVVNAVKCLSCKRVLVSTHRHDFRQCKCGTFADGGRDYLRRGGDPANIQELAIMFSPRHKVLFLADDAGEFI